MFDICRSLVSHSAWATSVGWLTRSWKTRWYDESPKRISSNLLKKVKATVPYICLRWIMTLRRAQELQQRRGRTTRGLEGTLQDQVGKNRIKSGPASESLGPLTSPDLPPTLWRTGRESKPRRIGINLQKNTIQVDNTIVEHNTGWQYNTSCWTR